ncbi:methyl-accepting chemotaxis protein [Desulfovibrio sp. JC022]|uniref:methyl-accepting chemotaxis protein n=1 Tax=Desulfovibrio sp. JC022 TaxID=2593642 RepID=UPI0013D38F52|nr:methyl-accepting chemotaxis protein [Desulfovibrio sp. JC022]NDV23051.1 methyl-accepting chemotaxis protein [Desulfovibrio sp. JC022]
MNFRDWSLKNKIIIPTFCVVALILATSTWIMTDQARSLAVEQASKAADTEAKGYGNEISETLGKALTVTRTLASMFEEGANYKIIPDREFLDSVLIHTLKKHPGLSGAWCTFPGKSSYDDREQEYMDKYKGAYRNWYYRDGGSIAASYVGDEDLSGQAWFEKPMSGNVETLSEPYPWEVDGKTFWLCSTGYPVKKKGRNIGIVGVDFYLNDLLETVLQIKPFETGYAYLVTNKGTIVAHPDSELQTKNILERVNNKHKNNVENAITNGRAYSYVAESAAGNMEYITYAPIKVGKTSFPWSIALVIPMDKVEAQANAIAHNSLIVSVVAILILLGILFILAGVISKPILKTADYTTHVAEGNLDAPLDINQKDEIGRMADSLRDMVGELKKTILKAEDETRKAEDESAKAREATAEAEKARAKADMARSEGLHHAADRVEQVLERVVSASEQMSVQSNEMLQGSEIQSDRIASTATAMEEMNATVLEIARNASDAAEASTEAQDKAKDGASVVDKSKTSLNQTVAEVNSLKNNMEELGKQAKGTETIVGVITDIADQTNLLALNAAIEAARAGEAGRGFAVVADEVRKLAEKTMTATGEVSNSINAIQRVAGENIRSMETVYKRIEEANEFSESSGGVLKEIVGGAEESAIQIQSIATAAEEQSATSEEINNSVEEISRITAETANGAREFALALESLAEQVSEMKNIVDDLKDE